MTSKERLMIVRLAASHDYLAIQTLALTAVLGSVLEQDPPQRERVTQWCQALAGISGIPLAKLQHRANSLFQRPLKRRPQQADAAAPQPSGT
jgi:hypothetical protein